MTQDTDSLIERVEAASGPDRELDAQIACRFSGNADAFVEQSPFNGAWCVYQPCRRNGKRLIEGVESLPFTASIDAAMTLVPKGYGKAFGDYWCEGEEKPPFVGECYDLERIKNDLDYEAVIVWAATPALAICAAALKARKQ